MSEEQTQDRSPRSPTIPLEEAIETTRKLYQQARTASIKPDVAVKALGYSGTNGAAMTTLATLAQYGLVDRSGGNVAVTPLAVKIFHPISEAQKTQAIQDAANTPAVFREMLKGFEECTGDVITGHLIQNRFTPERARKVAQVFISNRSFAQLDSTAVTQEEGKSLAGSGVTAGNALTGVAHTANINTPQPMGIQAAFPPVVMDGNQKMLAQYNIPLGGNQAQLTFVGQNLTPDDFDELIEFVNFTKRQLERRLRNTPQPQGQPTTGTFPKAAVWKNSDHDKPVSIVGEMGEHDGEKYFQTDEGTGVPASELDFGQ